MTIRFPVSAILFGASVLFAAGAGAQQTYSFVGKFARSNGPGINIPLVGNNPGNAPNCGATSPRTSTNMTMTMVKTKGMVPGMTPIFQGFRITGTQVPQKKTPPFTAGAIWTMGGMAAPWKTMFANPYGCVSGFAPRAAFTDMATGPMGMFTKMRPAVPALVATMPGAGAAFDFPPYAFSAPWPDKTVALQVPILGMTIPQLATSFRVSLPPKSLPMAFTTKGAATRDHPGGTMIVRSAGGMGGPMTPMGGTTMGAPLNIAMFRHFHKSAWKSQTGRAGAKFTWCPNFYNSMTMMSQCEYVTQAGTLGGNSAPMIVKYIPGGNRFGGTMGHVASAGPNPSTLAIAVLGVAGPVQLLGLAGVGPVATGRGYADYLTDPLMGGNNFPMFMIGSALVPQIMAFQQLITMVTGVNTGPGSMVTVTLNLQYGFPFTTGQVVVRNTGYKLGGGVVVVTLTGEGNDTVTAMGARNISLVAGAVATVPILRSNYVSLDQVALPEPGAGIQLCVGAIALLGIALWRSRRCRA